jgi:hypothetical protein
LTIREILREILDSTLPLSVLLAWTYLMQAELLADTTAVSAGGVSQPELPFGKAPGGRECHRVHHGRMSYKDTKPYMSAFGIFDPSCKLLPLYLLYVESCCRPYFAGVQHSVSDQIQNLQNCYTTPNKNDQ